jgi:hypothetical protein
MGKERPGRDADPSSPSSAVVMKGYSYTSTPPTGRTACTGPQRPYKGALYLFTQIMWLLVTQSSPIRRYLVPNENDRMGELILYSDVHKACTKCFSVLLDCIEEHARFSPQRNKHCSKAGLGWTALVYLTYADRGTPDTHHRFM